MWNVLLGVIFFALTLYGGEYDFDMGATEQKPYEYSGYLRLEEKAQRLNPDEKYQNYLHLEGLFDFSYNYEMLKLKTSAMATHDYIENKMSKNNFPLNEFYLEAKLTQNHSLLAGKESLGWGKGYFFNPVAFFDRAKDPTQPTLAREGFVIAKYSYNKSFESELKNLSIDFVYLPSTKTINQDFSPLANGDENTNNMAMRVYLLLYDTDIDIIYNYCDVASDKMGIDFSKNIQTNFELHGEYAKVIDAGYSYLAGLRYLTDFELTIISEYLFRSDGLTKGEIENSTSILPFIAKDYMITLITQKEPFDWLYSSIYYKNMMNLQDYSQQNKAGMTYGFRNNMEIDFSYNINNGENLSEFGKKQVKDFVWLRLTWSF
ncbi:hypothetical protein KKG72_01015 [bacterium]|nr:hypothetical protein [bacterium]MBU1994933.1 hypothetical protein [bacterium]